MHPIKPEHNVFTLTPTYIGDSVGYVFNNTHEAFEDILHKVVNTRDYQIIKSDNEDPYYRYGVWVGESRIGWLKFLPVNVSYNAPVGERYAKHIERLHQLCITKGVGYSVEYHSDDTYTGGIYSTMGLLLDITGHDFLEVIIERLYQYVQSME